MSRKHKPSPGGTGSYDDATPAPPASVSVGDRVFFFPKKAHAGYALECGCPLAATVAYVAEDGRVNLSVIDRTGTVFGYTSAAVRGAGEDEPGECYCAAELPVEETESE